MPVRVQVAYKPICKPEIGVNDYQGFTPGKTEILREGMEWVLGRTPRKRHSN